MRRMILRLENMNSSEIRTMDSKVLQQYNIMKELLLLIVAR